MKAAIACSGMTFFYDYQRGIGLGACVLGVLKMVGSVKKCARTRMTLSIRVLMFFVVLFCNVLFFGVFTILEIWVVIAVSIYFVGNRVETVCLNKFIHGKNG